MESINKSVVVILVATIFCVFQHSTLSAGSYAWQCHDNINSQSSDMI